MPSHSGPILATHPDGFRVIDCDVCGFAHLDPIPADDQLRELYHTAYYEEIYSGWYEKELGEQAYWQLEYADRLAAFDRLRATDRRRLLDIGCSFGFFLAYAQERGWEVLGIEPSAFAAARAEALGVPVLCGLLQDVMAHDSRLAPAGFDAVHLKLVLEHVTDPLKVCRDVERLLRPGGVVCAEVPNDFNPLQAAVQQLTQKPAYWVAPPFHINYFTFQTLERLLHRAGLTPVQRDATFPMELFILMGDDYVGNDQLGRAMHARRMRLESALEAAGHGDLRRKLYAFLASEGIGREAIVYARKDSAGTDRPPLPGG